MPVSSPRSTQIDPWISDLRSAPFLAAAAGDHDRAVALYEWNVELAGALLEVFAPVEVLLRNAVHRHMRSITPDNALRSWLVDGDRLHDEDVRRVTEVIGRIKRSRQEPTEDRVVAGLTLGFWSGIFGRRYEDLWRASLYRAFPHGDGSRNQIAGYVNRIIRLRNRVAHHESLIEEPVSDRYDDAVGLAAAIDPAAAAWVRDLSRVDAVLARRP